MNGTPSTFRRVLVAAGMGLFALMLALGMGGIWSALLASNLAANPAIPWSVVIMGLLLWLMWQYLGGRWRPTSTAEARRRLLRARRLPGPMLAWALATGGLSIVALIGYWIVLFQVVKVQGNVLPDFSTYPPVTVVLALIMASLVAALAEEAGLRGYFQGTLERELRNPLAIVISSLLIAPGHALTQGFLWPTMLWYFFVDMMLGGLAYLTKSTVPSVAVHAVGLLIFFTVVWPQDPHRRLVWDTGPDGWFWLNVAQAAIFTILAVLAFRQLARIAADDAVAQDGSLLSTPTG